jgi:hypothetical protein
MKIFVSHQADADFLQIYEFLVERVLDGRRDIDAEFQR